MPPEVTVILPTRNPNPERLRRTLAALARQTLAPSQWELLVVDNASDQPWALPPQIPTELRRLTEPNVGLTFARIRGITAARGDLLVFVDDDNVLSADYLATVIRLFAEHRRVGAAGGRVMPEWESPPAGWTREFHGLLALRDAGSVALYCRGGAEVPWPAFAPVGAGLVVRRAGALAYAEAVGRDSRRQALDRAGRALSSGGDNDLVFTILHAGGDVAYFPELRLTHLIPRARLLPDYLARLNEGIMRTWVVVLSIHGQCPWPAIPPWTVPFRCARAWVRSRAWRSPADRVRWGGRCGQFHGQGLLSQMIFRP